MNNRESQLAAIAKEERQNRKRMHVGIVAGFSGGIGLALFLLNKIFSGITASETTNTLLDHVCLTMMLYTAIIILVFLFRRKWLLLANNLLLYLIVPGILLKIFADYM